MGYGWWQDKHYRAGRAALPDRAPLVPQHAQLPPAQGPALVRRYCDALGIDYLETGLLTSYQQALASLHQAGAPIRNAETV